MATSADSDMINRTTSMMDRVDPLIIFKKDINIQIILTGNTHNQDIMTGDMKEAIVSLDTKTGDTATIMGERKVTAETTSIITNTENAVSLTQQIQMEQVYGVGFMIMETANMAEGAGMNT